MQYAAVFQKIYDFYKHFYIDLGKIPKRDRYTWGTHCETLALEAISLSAKASYLPRNEKCTTVRELSFIVDLLKIHLRLGSDLRILDYKKYLARELQLLEIGKMIGGWLKACM